MMPRPHVYRGAVMVMGMSGLVAQMVLLREFLIISAGNELSIGIILANWLVIEAAGAGIAGRLPERYLGRSELFVLITAFFCLSLPPALYGIRILKPAFGLSIGETPGLGLLFTSSFLLLLPSSLTHGALFPLACGSAPPSISSRDSLIGRVYILETAGTLIGGILWTWLLIPHFHSFEIVMGVAVVNGAICLVLLSVRGASRKDSGILAPSAFLLAVSVLLGSAVMLAAGGTGRLHRTSVGRQWPQQNIVEYRNSIHGNITVVENHGQYSFFTDGTLSLITPIPDSALVKTYAHISLTAHPDPRTVLLIGTGPGGLINEMLKHPGLDRIDYAELDPSLITLLRLYSTDLTEAELDSPRVSVKLIDGRSHLLRSGERYDVILSGLAEPSDLQTNRLYTKEFYLLASRRLSADGILVVRLPGALGLQNQELAELLAALYHSLAAAFPSIRVLPGEGETMVIASADTGIMDYSPDILIDRLSDRGLPAADALTWDIERRLHPGWQSWFLNLVDETDRTQNRDFAPLGVFLSLSYWNTLHSPGLGPFFRLLRNARMWLPIAVLVLITILFTITELRDRRSRGPVVAPSVFGTGVAGMLLSLSLIFSFQSLFGHLFSWIGLLTAFFMAGSAAGAWLTTRRISRTRNPALLMAVSELAVLLAAVVLPFVVPRIGPMLENASSFNRLRGLFLLLPFVCGLLTGAQFPLAAGLRERAAGRTASAAGRLYAADLTGGWIGGLLGGVILLPVLGLTGTGMILAFLKLITLSIFGLSLLRQTET